MKFLMFCLALISMNSFAQEGEDYQYREHQEEVLEGSDVTPLTPEDDRLLIDDVDLGNRIEGQEDPGEQEGNQVWREEENLDTDAGDD